MKNKMMINQIREFCRQYSGDKNHYVVNPTETFDQTMQRVNKFLRDVNGQNAKFNIDFLNESIVVRYSIEVECNKKTER